MKKAYISPLVEEASQIKVSSFICVSQTENGAGADSGPTKHRHYYDPEESKDDGVTYGNIW